MRIGKLVKRRPYTGVLYVSILRLNPERGNSGKDVSRKKR
jgi:hypothetical protein